MELGCSWKLVGIGASVCVGDRRNLYDGRWGTILGEGAGDGRHVVVHVEWGHRRITCGGDVGPTCLSTLRKDAKQETLLINRLPFYFLSECVSYKYLQPHEGHRYITSKEHCEVS